MKQGNPLWFQVLISSDDCTQTCDREILYSCNTSFMKVNVIESLQKWGGGGGGKQRRLSKRKKRRIGSQLAESSFVQQNLSAKAE